MNLKKTISAIGVAALITGGMSLTSCNEKHKSDLYESPVNLAVTSFYLKSDLGSQELDTIFFSIDLDRHVIFNADSLRKGTDVSKVVAAIKFSNDVSEAVIEMSGGTTREGEIDYQKSPNDSIDFTGNVVLHVKADDDNIGTSYRIKVNVHKMDADSLYWDQTAKAELPARMANPKRQKTVDNGGTTVSLIEEADGTYTIATTEALAEYHWEKREATFPFTPRIETLSASDNKLWMLDTNGALYMAEGDMDSWQNTGETWSAIIGAYTETVVGLKAEGDATVFAQFPKKSINEREIPSDFPVENISNFVTLANKWTSSPVAFFTGGRTASGSLSDSTWAFDGAEWIKLSTGGIPALEGASIIPYYNYRPSAAGNTMLEYKVWILMGGKKADGDFNRTVYMSYDNGVNWTKGASSLQLPECIPSMTGCDIVVADSRLEANISDAWKAPARGPKRVAFEIDGDVIVWGCPYIYMFGGYAADGQLYNTIWKGVLSRLSFTPIF